MIDCGVYVQVEDRVAVEDARMVEIDVRRTIGARAGGDDERVGREPLLAAVRFVDLDGVRHRRSVPRPPMTGTRLRS